MAMAKLFNLKTIFLLSLILLSVVAKIECGLRGRVLDEDTGDLEASLASKDSKKGDKDKGDLEASGSSKDDKDKGDSEASKGAKDEGDSEADGAGKGDKDNGDSEADGAGKGDKDNGDAEADDAGKGAKDNGDSEADGAKDNGAKDNGDSEADGAKDNGDPEADGASESAKDNGAPEADDAGDTGNNTLVADAKGDIGNGTLVADAKTAVSGSSGQVFDVTKFGATGDGKKDNSKAFMQAWLAACKGGGTLRVPSGNFVTGPLVFQGPCKSTVTVQVAGTVTATTDLSQYSEDAWILFEKVNGVVLNGGGTFDGKGASAWPYNNCKKSSSTCNLPTNIKFIHVSNAVVQNIKSVDSKFFHFHVTDSSGFKASNVTIVAPDDSPNTDGIHLSDTDKISITNSKIGTGDDCISIGQGVVGCVISKITCGPGHGISVGSLGKRQNEAPLNGVTVSDSTLSNTDNGVRIKTFSGSPPGSATGIHFSNIAMTNVKNPIIIDQYYGGKKGGTPSRVKVTDVTFTNIHGTSSTPEAVSLLCSSAFPCPVQMTDIDLTYNGKPATSECTNAKVTYKGKQNPTACKQ